MLPFPLIFSLPLEVVSTTPICQVYTYKYIDHNSCNLSQIISKYIDERRLLFSVDIIDVIVHLVFVVLILFESQEGKVN